MAGVAPTDATASDAVGSQPLREVGGRPSVPAYVVEIWRRRHFAAAMPMEEMRAQHMTSVLGNLWHILNPLLLTGVYYLVFGVVLGTDRGVDNFMAFLAIGVFVYHYTQKSVMSGARSVVGNQGLIRSLQFPRAILPLAAVLAQLIAFVPPMLVIFAIALVTGESLAWSWLLLAPLVLAQGVLNLGGSLLFARLTHKVPDMENILPFLFRLAFYGSGVLYSVDRFIASGLGQAVFDLNPLYGYISMARWAIMGDAVSSTALVATAAWTVLALVVGFLYFIAGEQEYANE